eukprot:325060_1
MALYYSTIVSIIYFVVNIIFMFGLAFYVYKSGNHKLKSKSYLKDVWSQRKIFWPLIIHFYDTATDIGVIYNWSQLMKHEEEPDTNYESVDMKTFFWCGIAFLIVFRVLILLFSILKWFDGDGEWYHVLFVLFDLYIFVLVYESFNEAHGIITKNAERRQRNAERKKQRQEAMEICTDKAQHTQIALVDEVEIEPAGGQIALQLLEAATESMPQIVLQSVFIIRSANDQQLVDGGSNIGLLLFSVLASLFSTSNKFVWMDKEFVCDIAKSLHIKPRESFEDCIHYWYIIRALWRLCHVLSKFAAFTLIWAVMGGAWLPIWVGSIYIFWSMFNIRVVRIEENHEKYECGDVLVGVVSGILCIIAVIDPSKPYASAFLYKWIETTIALIAITMFATIQFDCGICASSGFRMLFEFDTETNNDRIFIYWTMLSVAHVMDAVLYVLLYFANIWMGEEDVIYHGRWTHTFGNDTKGEQFKNFIADYENERITGIRMSAGAGNMDIKSIQFQINGIWRGRIGSQEPINEQELRLDDDEYVNKVTLWSMFGVLFGTNKGNIIKAGTLGEDEENITTLHGDFKLRDCKGRSTTNEIWALSFLWHKVTEITE